MFYTYKDSLKNGETTWDPSPPTIKKPKVAKVKIKPVYIVNSGGGKTWKQPQITQWLN